MMLGQTADQVAQQVLYVHPALTEVVEQALLRVAARGDPPPMGAQKVVGTRRAPKWRSPGPDPEHPILVDVTLL